ncbi:MASE1 domain-containing protein [Candidatus Parcubacteria bacterium]|nr:MASE1 domain-containing protein [Candidatus Parcubacteria bacterium]
MDRLPIRLSLWYLIQLLFLCNAYFFTARLGLSLDAVGGFATLVWPPTAIALAALYLYGYRLWPGIFLGAFLVNLWTGAPILVALGIGIGNTLEAIIGIYLLHRFDDSPHLFENVRSVVKFIFLVAFIATLVSATIGVFSLWLGGIVPSLNIPITLSAWWVGDILSALIIFPLLIIVLSKNYTNTIKSNPWEAIGLLLITTIINVIIFWSPSGELREASLLYLVFLPLTWSAFRFGVFGTVISIFLTSRIAIWSTVYEHGPFVQMSLSEGLTYLQLFMAVIAITFLVFSAVVSELKKAVATRDTFMNIASHELKTPITSLRLYTQVIEKQINGREDIPILTSSLSKINRQIDKLMTLIEDLLNVSRIQLDKLELHQEAFDLQVLVQEVVSDIQVDSLHHTIVTKGTLSKNIFADRDRIGQVLINLLNNAIKYSPHADTVLIVLKDEKDKARVIIQDFGIGIHPDHHQIIFNRFYRIISANNTEIPGLGIGLFISQEIIRRHGGQIEIKSELGKGSEFSFCLACT